MQRVDKMCSLKRDALICVGLPIHSWLLWHLPQISCVSHFLLKDWQTSCWTPAWKWESRESHGTPGKYSFSIKIINIWNSLPESVVTANTINCFKTRLDKFCNSQDMKFDYNQNLTGLVDDYILLMHVIAIHSS